MEALEERVADSRPGRGRLKEFGRASKPEAGLIGFDDAFGLRAGLSAPGAQNDCACVAGQGFGGRRCVFGKGNVRGACQLRGVHALDRKLRRSLNQLSTQFFYQSAQFHVYLP
jgi:hypothetical protein